MGLFHDLVLIFDCENYITVQILILPPLSPFPLDFSHLCNLFKLLINKLVSLCEPHRGVIFNEKFIAGGVCVCVCVHALSHVRLFVAPCTVASQAPLPWNFPGKNTRAGCYSLLQGIFLTQVATQKMLIPFLFLFKGFEYTTASWPS